MRGSRLFRRVGATRAKIMILILGLAATMLIVAACSGAAATATPEAVDKTAPPAEEATSLNGTGQVSGPEQGLAEDTPAVTSEESSETDAMTAIASVETSISEGASVVIQRDTGSEGAPVAVDEGVSSVSGRAVVQAGLVSASPSVQIGTNQQVGIWVTGRGEVMVSPDLVLLNAGVEARATTVSAARVQAADAMDRMIQVLEARGIESTDIQTRFFNISPEYRFNRLKEEQELVGYRVNNQVSVQIRDLGSVGVIIDELAEAGGDLVRIQGIRFTVEDTKELETQARAKAVADLMAKAQQFADLTGVQLGSLVFLSESGGFSPRITNLDQAFQERAKAVAAPAAMTPISGGELTVSVMVQGTFAIIE